MAHHGKILKRQIERLGLTQSVAAKKMGYVTHQAFTALYQKEEFNEKRLADLTAAFGFSREIFFPISTEKAPSAGADGACWQQLVAAQQKIIELQEVIMTMQTPNLNAPVGRKQVA